MSATPAGTADLQKGEHYVDHLDYWQNSTPTLISYDLACCYERNRAAGDAAANTAADAPSAKVQYNKNPDATLKSYTLWSEAESAWWAGCDRGEHGHFGGAAPSSSSRTSHSRSAAGSPRVPASPPVAVSPPAGRPPAVASPRRGTDIVAPVPLVVISSRTPVSDQVEAQPKGSDFTRPPDSKRPPPHAPQGRMLYAVRASDDLTGGAVFSDYAEARAWYNEKQFGGFEPTMFTGHSLTTAVNFTERFADAAATAEGQRRRNFVEEENRARRTKVTLSLWRARERGEILENLATAREDCGESSGHLSDESDLSRSTSSLASELEARWSYGDEWRYYRTNGEHGKS
ncbi:hypothetical protein C8F04DRAFT_1264073 [Mycena alexandri]|uniref:Uncharacterized protein n=1 Tax=Mycena alexandri TaxID=1745969 RepID=A0AAD6WYU2_9AGAR|nr:hypothetical protein C8F04DRAFT_1264073 [Mycena alexandri]